VDGQPVDVHVSGPDLLIFLSSTVSLPELIQQLGGLSDELGGSAETGDGRHLKLEGGSVSRVGTSSLLEGKRSEATLKFRSWSLEDDDHSSVAWIAPVKLPSGSGFDPGPGNLRLFAGESDKPRFLSTGHLYLEGANRYVILHRNERVGLNHEWLVIEPIDQPAPDQNILREEFRLLQFTLGVGASIGMVRGVTKTLESRTACSVPTHGLQAHVPAWAEAPVPIKGEAWVRPFFHRLSRALNTSEIGQGKSAVHMFLNALSSLDADTTIILMATAVRTLAHAYLVERDLISSAQLISEHQRWREWVQQYKSEIVNFGVRDWTKTKERIINAEKPLMEDLLATACDDAELEADNRLLQQISSVYETFERRGWASDANEEGIDRQFATANLFVALLGALIGYEGKIGYTRYHGLHFGRVQLSVSKEDREQAKKIFQEQVDLPERDLVTWPEYEVPGLPDNDLVRDLAAFASDLRSRTDGIVSAGLRPSLSKMWSREDNEETNVDHLRFVLRLADDPSKRIVPFDVQIEEDDLLRIEGWKEEDQLIGTAEELREFKRTLSESDTMRRYVQQLLLTHQNANG